MRSFTKILNLFFLSLLVSSCALTKKYPEQDRMWAYPEIQSFEQQDAEELAERVQLQERQMYPLVVSWFCADRLKMNNNKAILDDKILQEMGYAGS